VHFTGIFQNSRFFIEGFGLNLWFRLFSRRYLYTVHNVMPHGKENHRIFRWLYWLAYRIPNVLIVHTTLAKQQLTQQFGMAQHKIQVVSIGLNEEMPMTDLTPAQARRRLGYGDTEKIFLFFGKMDEYKGLDLLLQAFDQLDLPDIKLHVAGVFRDLVYRQKIMLIISQARRKNDIRLDERMVPNEEVEILFKGADMLAMPYRNIYQSGLLFLCYRFGMPLVATDVGSLREFVGPDMGLIVKPNDIGSFADGLWRFCTSKILYNRENIRAKGIKYQWPSICRCLVPLYQ
jgi:glycosyltransferase involved in cell wall biosynthesis